MNKIYPGQAHIATRLHKIRSPELNVTGLDENRAVGQTQSIYHMTRIPGEELMTLEPRQLKPHKKNISFNKLSDWTDRESSRSRPASHQQSPVLTMQGSKPSNSLSNTQTKTNIRTIVEVTPQSARPGSRHESLSKKSVEVSTKVFVTDEKVRTQMHKITNSDLDCLIKEVMQFRYDEYARIPAVDLCKHFSSSIRWKGRRAASSLSRSRALRNSSTIEEQPLTCAGISSSFPVRKHKRSKSSKGSHSLIVKNRSKTIDTPINLQDVQRVLQKYNNSGLYKDKLRISFSQSPPPREFSELQQVGVIGKRIAPYR